MFSILTAAAWQARVRPAQRLLARRLSAALAVGLGLALGHAHAFAQAPNQTQRLGIEAAAPDAGGQAEDAKRRIELLAARYRRLVLERQLDQWDSQIQLLARLAEQLRDSARRAAPVDRDAVGNVRARWQPILALERDVARLDLPVADRARLTQSINDMRRVLAAGASDAPAADSAATPRDDDGVVLAVVAIERQLELCRTERRACQNALAEIPLTALDALDAGVTVESLETELADAWAGLQTPASDFAAGAEAPLLPPLRVRSEPGRAAASGLWTTPRMWLAATLALGMLLGLALGSLRRLGAGPLRAADAARRPLSLPVLGTVPVRGSSARAPAVIRCDSTHAAS